MEQQKNTSPSITSKNSQTFNNFWDFFDVSKAKQASAIVNVVVQPLTTPESLTNKKGVSSVPRLRREGLQWQLNCPSCGYDVTSLFPLEERQGAVSNGRGDAESPRGFRGNNKSNKMDPNYSYYGPKPSHRSISDLLQLDTNTNANRPSNNNTSAPPAPPQRRLSAKSENGERVVTIRDSSGSKSLVISRKPSSLAEKPIFRTTDHPVCIQDGHSPDLTLSTSRLYMQDIQIVQNMRECWERYLELKFEGEQPPEPEVFYESNFPPPNSKPDSPQQLIMTSDKSIQTSPNIQNNSNPARSSKPQIHPPPKCQASAQADLENPYIHKATPRPSPDQFVTNDFERNPIFTSSNQYHPETDPQNQTEPHQSETHRTSKTTGISSSQEKVQQWMEQQGSVVPNITQQSTRDAANQTSNGINTKNKNYTKKVSGQNIIELATDFQLLPCCAGSAIEHLSREMRDSKAPARRLLVSENDHKIREYAKKTQPRIPPLQQPQGRNEEQY